MHFKIKSELENQDLAKRIQSYTLESMSMDKI